MMLPLLIAAQATAPEPIDPGSWLHDGDYPASARRDGAEGRVSVRLRINASGRVVGCEVTLSTGRVDLDEATCRRVSERGRFRPARTAAGKPTEGEKTLTFSWMLGNADRQPAVTDKATLIVSYDGDGRLVECREEGPVDAFIGHGCQAPFIRTPPPAGLSRDEIGGPRTFHLVSAQRFDGRAPTMARPAGATVISEVVVRVVVDADGDITDCEVVSSEGMMPAAVCERDGTGVYEPGAADRIGHVGTALWVVQPAAVETPQP